MHCYVYNNTVPLLNIAKIQIFLKLNLALFRLTAIRPGSTSAIWLQIFHKRKVITSSLRNYYSKEALSTVPWSFFLSVAPFLSLLLTYKKVRNSQKRCKSSATASDCVSQKQLLTHVNIIMKHTPIYNRYDIFMHVLLYIVSFEIARLHAWTNRFSIVICDNTAALPCKCYC